MNTNINNYTSDKEDIEEEDLVIQTAVTASISAALATLDYSQRYYNKEPGVHKHVFQALIVALQDAGHMQ